MTNSELVRAISRHRGPVLVSIYSGTDTDEPVMVQVLKNSICEWLKKDPEAAATLKAKVNGDNAMHLIPNED